MTNEEFIEKYSIGLDISVDKNYVYININDDDKDFVVNPQIRICSREGKTIRQIINETLDQECRLEIKQFSIDENEWNILRYLLDTREREPKYVCREDHGTSSALFFYYGDNTEYYDRIDFKGADRFKWLVPYYNYGVYNDRHNLNCIQLGIAIQDGEYI